jgi:hypothetical protein
MSFISRLWKGVRGVVAPAIGTAIGGPLGGVVGGVLAGSSQPRVPAAPVSSFASMPGTGFQPAMAILPRTLTPLAPTIGRGAGMVVGAGIAAARRLAQSAATYCRRHPQWCSTIGGIAAVEGLIRSGQLPPIKRRRARGITARELQSFKRVTKTLNKWCKVAPPTRRARGGAKCR